MAEAEFVCRSLTSKEELLPWSAMCEDAFSQKLIPPLAQHFLDHVRNDDFQSSKHSNVFIVEEVATGRFVSSVRVFLRHISLSGASTLAIAGIGEVCTLAAFRGRGLSSRLQEFVYQEIVRNKGSNELPDVKGFLLHCAPHLIPFYASAGYASLKAQWCNVNIKVNINAQEQLMQFEEEDLFEVRCLSTFEQIGQLVDLSNEFNSRMFGPVIRSERYMQKWCGAKNNCVCLGLFRKSSPNSSPPLAFTTTGVFQGRVQLKDFGADAFFLADISSPLVINKKRSVLQKKLFHAALEIHRRSEVCNDEMDWTSVRMPRPVASFFNFEVQSCGEVEIDLGWMFKQINDDCFSPQNQDSFLFWPVDHF